MSRYVASKYDLLKHHCFLFRDLVHRQTASAVVQHMSLGVYGFGCEDSLNHLLNYVWPNVFETSPHVIQAVMGALEGLRVAIGPCRMLQYCLQVCPDVCCVGSSYQTGFCCLLGTCGCPLPGMGGSLEQPALREVFLPIAGGWN